MAKAAPPRKPGRMKGPGKKKSEIEQLEEAAAAAPPRNGTPRASGELGLEAPTEPVEVPAETKEEEEAAKAAASGAKSQTGLTVNIAKLQAMTMTDLNGMAKGMGIENFGTMRKHEVIFHILQKNAERSGILFSEGVLE